MSAMRAPAGLGSRGRAAWRALTTAFEFRADETELLTEFCRTLDVIERLRAELDGEPLTVATQRDGIKAHPLLTELRAQREQLRKLGGQLKLADIDAAYGVQGAATGRWDRRSHRRTAG